jgi:hypothetical protein
MQVDGESPQSWAPAGIRERHVWIALAIAMAAAAALALSLGRGIVFSPDEIRIFDSSANFDLRTGFLPFNGHLILTWRIAFAAILNIFGAGYLPFRLLTIAAVLVTAGMFFVFAKRRVGAVAALAPTLVLLVYGSDPRHVLQGNGFDVLLPLAAGIGALLLLDRGDLKGDVCACLLLCLALATYSVALPLLAGAAVLILIGSDRWRRAWVFLVPGVLYAVWLLWSRNQAGSTGDYTHLSNLLLAPSWAFNSLAAVGSSLLGLNYLSLGSGWGPVIALAAVAAFAWRLWQGQIPRWLWAVMAVPATLWLIAATAALTAPNRVPQRPDYLFPATIAVLLVAAEAARGVRIQRRGMTVLYAAAAIGVATNIALLRDASRNFRTFVTVSQSSLTAAEIIGQQHSSELPATSTTLLAITGESAITGKSAATRRQNVANYFDAVRQFGSPGFSLASLRTQSEATRDTVDRILAQSLGVSLRPSSPPSTPCRSIKAMPGRAARFRLPTGGVVLKAGQAPGPVILRRFGSAFTVSAGQLVPGEWTALSVPVDSAPDPWYASTSATPLLICGPPG